VDEQKVVECWVDGGYSPVVRKGVWCFIVDGGKPSYGFEEDPESKLTNNVMEYRAVIELLKNLADGSHINVNSDSQLIVNQLIKVYRINFSHLAELNEEVWAIADQKKLSVSFKWIPRDTNPAGKFIEDNQSIWFHHNFHNQLRVRT
jgi:ribonuclease HI